MTDLLKKEGFKCTERATKAFQCLKDALTLRGSDPELRKLIHKLSIMKEDIKGFYFTNQQLRWNGRSVIESDTYLIVEIITMWHASVHGGHSGIDHIYRRITSLFYWKGLGRDVEDYIKGCEI